MLCRTPSAVHQRRLGLGTELPHGDRHGLDALEGQRGLGGVSLDLAAQWAGGGRQGDLDRCLAGVIDGDRGHHAELHDVEAQLGVDHVPKAIGQGLGEIGALAWIRHPSTLPAARLDRSARGEGMDGRSPRYHGC